VLRDEELPEKINPKIVVPENEKEDFKAMEERKEIQRQRLQIEEDKKR